MRTSLQVTITLLVSLAAIAQEKRVTPRVLAPVAVRKVHRDPELEAAVQVRSKKIAELIHPKSKAKLDLAALALVRHLAEEPKNDDPLAFAKKQVRDRFRRRLSAEQLDLLSFFVLAEASRLLSHPEELKETLDGMNDMSEMSSLRLQMTMDRRSKFISTLSNMMKKISTTQDALVQNLK